MNEAPRIVINWNDINYKEDEISLTKLVESNSKIIRDEYINFIEDIPISKNSNVSLNDRLKIDKKFSLWWMSIIYEKNFYKSPNIENCLKLIALKNYLIIEKIADIQIVNVPVSCKESIIKLSHNISRKIKISFQKVNKPRNKIKEFIPLFIRSIYTLIKYLYSSIKINKTIKKKLSNEKKEILIVSYFINFNKQEINNNNFYSDYWGTLINDLKKEGYSINWLHMFSSDLSNSKYVKKVNKINLNNNFENHYFIESFISLKLFLIVGLKYIKFIFLLFRFYNQKTVLESKINNHFFWSLLKKDLRNSLLGPNIIKNIFIYLQLREFFSFIPQQKKILYLHEGQGWEKALISIANRNRNIDLIGVIQSPVRFWDIKLFKSLLDEQKTGYESQLTPNKIAINTYNGLDLLEEYGVKKEKIIMVEPLRYKIINYKSENINLSEKLSILVLGSYVKEVTEDLVLIINKLSNELDFDYKFRPHPGQIIQNKFNNFKYDLSKNLSNAISRHNVMIVAGDSSVAIDVYLAKKELLIYLKKGDLNYSPLRNNKNVNFLYNEESIREYISNLIFKYKTNKNSLEINNIQKMYSEDNTNSKWKKLIG